MPNENMKPILCLDFDGVLHSYESGWQGADVIPDPPVPGAMRFIVMAKSDFNIAIYSSRSGQEGGIDAMKAWLRLYLEEFFGTLYGSSTLVSERADLTMNSIMWPTEKPPAFVSIDDRSICFDGTWPDINDLILFKPWNKR